MNTSTIIAEISADTGLPAGQVQKVLDALTARVLHHVEAGETVSLRGLCTIDARWQTPRVLRSVKDKRRINLDGRWVPRLRASGALRAAMLSRSPQHWRDISHQAAWRLAEALIGDLELYHPTKVPRLDQDTPLPMVAPICAVAFGPVWEHVLDTWNRSVSFEVRAEGSHLLRVAWRRWRAQEPVEP